jgi:hypothetical protein
VVPSQLIDCRPNNLLVDLPVGVLSQGLRYLLRQIPAIAPLPNKRRCLIQTMGPVTIEIINQQLVRQLLNYQPIFSGARFCLVVGFNDQSSFLEPSGFI